MVGHRHQSAQERFFSNIEIAGDCWEFRQRTREGYGRIKVNNRAVPAHRFSYEFFIGEIPVGLFVCHHCDNPPCVNPDHLFAGTHLDNIADRDHKGRQAAGPTCKAALYPERVTRGGAHWWNHANNPRHGVGEDNGRAKVTENDVLAIRAEARQKPISLLAAEYGLTTVAIRNIIKFKSWKHLKEGTSAV